MGAQCGLGVGLFCAWLTHPPGCTFCLRRQWHPPMLMPSHMRHMAAIVACHEQRPTLSIKLRPNQGGTGAGMAAPAA